MSSSYGLSAESSTCVICHEYPHDGPILSLSDIDTDLTIHARDLSPEDAEQFARKLFAAVQAFYVATRDRNVSAKTAGAAVTR